MKELAISLAVVWILAFAPFALAEELVLPPEVKATLERLELKIKAEGRANRKATSQAISEQGKQTAGTITEAGEATTGAIERQADVVKNESSATRKVIIDQGKKQEAIYLVSLGLLIVIVVVMVALLIALILRSLRSRKFSGQKNVVEFEINGQGYKYTPEIIDGKYQSPFQNKAGNNLLFSELAGLRRSAMTALKGDANKWLFDQEIAAGRLVRL